MTQTLRAAHCISHCTSASHTPPAPVARRFDVIRASDTRFFFYEAYVNQAAVDEHKAQAHFKLWSDFKASGGVVSSVSNKGSFPEWGGFQD